MVPALAPAGQQVTADVLDLDDESFRAYVLDRMHGGPGEDAMPYRTRREANHIPGCLKQGLYREGPCDWCDE
jgi:hypothetical protein